MKIALAQLNTIVGDCEGNLAGVLSALEKARGAGVDLVVFPEQTLPGYPAEDLLEIYVDGGTWRQREGQHQGNILGVSGSNDSGGHDLVDAGVGGVHGAQDFVETHFSF